MFYGVPHERQLKVRQVYKTLSISFELIKSDVNLKFSLNASCNVIRRRRFQRIELHENLIHFTEKTRNVKIDKRQFRAPKLGISGYCFMIFSTFSINTNLLLYVGTKLFVLKDVDMYPLNAHNLKCNVNPLTQDQIIFCLADTENHKFKDHRTCLYFEINYFVSVRSLRR